MNKKNIDLIRQALGAAESSIKLAKQLLNDIESGKTDSSTGQQTSQSNNLPGIMGSFDGENMVSASGETFPVPANYASKSMLVVGDTLKMVEEGKEKRFKQIEHVKRYRTTGIITKKEGKWKAITPEGSYKVLPVTVEHLGADVGSEVVLHLPANNLNVSYAAIESVKKATKEVTAEKSETTVEKNENATEAPKKPEDKPSSLEKETVKQESKQTVKPVEKVEHPKKEAVEVKTAKEPEKEDKPKVEPQKPQLSKPTPVPAKPEPAKEPMVPVVAKPEPVKQPTVQVKPEPATVVEVVEKVVAPAAKVAETAATVIETKPMEISPEEDELR